VEFYVIFSISKPRWLEWLRRISSATSRISVVSISNVTGGPFLMFMIALYFDISYILYTLSDDFIDYLIV